MKQQKNVDWTDYVIGLSDIPPLTSQWEKDMVSEIKDKISGHQLRAVLEVGCSNGRWLRWFHKEYGCEVYGLDNNTAGFGKRDVNFIVGDAFKLPCRDGSFDAVFSKGFMEHFKKHERFLLLKEQARVLRENGFLICEIPPFDISLEILYIKFRHDVRQELKHFIITEKELKRRFEELNLGIVSNKFLGWFFERFNIPKLFSNRFTSSESLLIGIKR
jgi:ubiquinone/menaquinone biosynthesis C-methylase UbiE